MAADKYLKTLGSIVELTSSVDTESKSSLTAEQAELKSALAVEAQKAVSSIAYKLIHKACFSTVQIFFKWTR